MQLTEEQKEEFIKFLKDSSKNQKIPFNERVVYKVCLDKFKELSESKQVEGDNKDVKQEETI